MNPITGLNGKSYLEKLQELGLMLLKAIRSRFDLLQTFKIIKGFERVNRDIWIELVGPDNPRPTRLTSHQFNIIPKPSRTDPRLNIIPKPSRTDPRLNIIPKPSRTDPRLNFFSNRVENSWNALPAKIKDARSLKIFKNMLDTT